MVDLDFFRVEVAVFFFFFFFFFVRVLGRIRSANLQVVPMLWYRMSLRICK